MKADKLYIKILVEKIVKDDEPSFGKLFSLLYERLVSFSKNYVQSRELAEEIVSDVFVRFWNNRKEAMHIENVEAYMYVAVKNQSLNNLARAPRIFVDVDNLNDFEINRFVDSFNPEKVLEAKELQHDINVAIDTLPTQCKVIFRLVKEDGLKYKEVAEILNISPRTVETQLVRALQRLDLALAPYVLNKLGRKNVKLRAKTNLNSLLSLLFF